MSHEYYMQRCLELAQRAKGQTTPNPMVGAVLVHNDRIIGEGWHHFYGGSHAEVNCLESVADEDKPLIPESTMYVSLEPCAHFGITPPCANRLVQEGIKKVVIANRDPFAKVNGKGIAILTESGAEVITGILQAKAWWMNRRFFCYHTHKRPYIILKWAQTADGYMGTTAHTSIQISGPESLAESHKWRTQEDAIMVGYTTALNDNPLLTARLYEGRQPLRIALDADRNLPDTHRIFNADAATWIVNEHEETQMGNVHYVRIPFGDNLLPDLLQRLHHAKVVSLIVEGGAILLNSFLDAGLWDEARVITATGKIPDGGVQAPEIKRMPEYTTNYGTDTLNLYVNAAAGIRYAEGMEL